MQANHNPPLRQHNGHILEVLSIARISTLNQDERSLAAQQTLLRRLVDLRCGQPSNVKTITTR